MKTKNLIIAVLSIGVIVLGILYFNKCQETISDQTAISENLYTSKGKCSTAEELCSTIKSECGKGIGKDSVYYVQELIRGRRNIFNVVYGYQINLKHVKEMYQAIEKFNADAIAHKSDTIQGIRFYEAVSRRLIKGEIQKEPDLVMIPYLQSCKDIYLVDNKKLTEYGVKMYAHFRPCPKLCGDESLYIHQ